MVTQEEVETAAKAIHAFELERGLITREWNGAHAEADYCGMARAALRAAEMKRAFIRSQNRERR